MKRRNFINTGGKCCMAAGLCAFLPEKIFAGEIPGQQEIKHSCEEKMDFAGQWLKRFMDVLDTNLDEKSKVYIMEENGRACASAYLKSIGKETPALLSWSDLLKHAKASTDGTYQVEDNTLYMTYMTNYQGKPAAESVCLCPFVEDNPEGLSKTYCQCSVGYIKEIYSRRLGQPVKVELLSSILWGDNRCKFKIEV
jgi:predicted hydrocarbon binding protein